MYDKQLSMYITYDRIRFQEKLLKTFQNSQKMNKMVAENSQNLLKFSDNLTKKLQNFSESETTKKLPNFYPFVGK